MSDIVGRYPQGSLVATHGVRAPGVYLDDPEGKYLPKAETVSEPDVVEGDPNKESGTDNDPASVVNPSGDTPIFNSVTADGGPITTNATEPVSTSVSTEGTADVTEAQPEAQQQTGQEATN